MDDSAGRATKLDHVPAVGAWKGRAKSGPGFAGPALLCPLRSSSVATLHTGAEFRAEALTCFPALFARDRTVSVEIGPVETLEGSGAELIARDHTVFAGQPHVSPLRAAPASTPHRAGPAEFLARNLTIAIGVEPIEHAGAAIGAAGLHRRAHLRRRDPAVTIGIHSGELLVRALEDSFARDRRAAAAAARLRQGNAGRGDQSGGDGERDRSEGSSHRIKSSSIIEPQAP